MPEVRPLSDDLLKIAREELNEDSARVDEALEAFKEWIRKTPHLKARMDDQFLIVFLRGCQYSLEKAKQKLDTFYTLRTHMPELMLDRDPTDQKLLAIIKLGWVELMLNLTLSGYQWRNKLRFRIGIPLPHTETPSSPRITLIRHGSYDPNLFSIQDVIKVSTMVTDILMIEDDNVVVAGQIGILDLANVSYKHFSHYTPTFIKKMSMLSNDASPLRHKGFHYINTPAGFENVFNVFKSIMNEKNKTSVS